MAKGTAEGAKNAIADRVQTAVLNYIGNVPMGGELIINQLRSSVLLVSRDIVDMSILELCIDGRSFSIRNYQLEPDELFVPDETREAVIIL